MMAFVYVFYLAVLAAMLLFTGYLVRVVLAGICRFVAGLWRPRDTEG